MWLSWFVRASFCALAQRPIDFHHSSFFSARQHLILPRLRAIGLFQSVDPGSQTEVNFQSNNMHVEGEGSAVDGAASITDTEGDKTGQRSCSGAGASTSVGAAVSDDDATAMCRAAALGDVCGMLALNWRRYHGRMCVGVDWNRFSLPDLEGIASCVGGRVLQRVCTLLVEDYDVWGHGLPDLLFWSHCSSTALIVEVKVRIHLALSYARWSTPPGVRLCVRALDGRAPPMVADLRAPLPSRFVRMHDTTHRALAIVLATRRAVGYTSLWTLVQQSKCVM